MSYCEWGSDSDVYIWQGTDGNRTYWVCHHVGEDHEKALMYFRREELLVHVLHDIGYGLKIPSSVIDQLTQEIANG